MRLTQPQHQSRLARIEGYLLIPHELLHVFGFWLAGKRCAYRWGRSYVTPLEPMSRRQQLIGRLFPFFVFTLLFVVSAVLAGLAYGRASGHGSFFWVFFWLGVMQISVLYAGTTLVDLRNAYLLIVDKPWHSRTPLDLFFWPVVDWEKVRKQAALQVEEKID